MASMLEEKEELRDLVTRYCLYIDSGRYDEWVATFTEEGVKELASRFTAACLR